LLQGELSLVEEVSPVLQSVSVDLKLFGRKPNAFVAHAGLCCPDLELGAVFFPGGFHPVESWSCYSAESNKNYNVNFPRLSTCLNRIRLNFLWQN